MDIATEKQKAFDDFMKRLEGLQPAQKAAILVCSNFIKTFVEQVNSQTPGAGHIGLTVASMQIDCEIEAKDNSGMRTLSVH
jgi:hypothetical protein